MEDYHLRLRLSNLSFVFDILFFSVQAIKQEPLLDLDELVDELAREINEVNLDRMLDNTDNIVKKELKTEVRCKLLYLFYAHSKNVFYRPPDSSNAPVFLNGKGKLKTNSHCRTSARHFAWS